MENAILQYSTYLCYVQFGRNHLCFSKSASAICKHKFFDDFDSWLLVTEDDFIR